MVTIEDLNESYILVSGTLDENQKIKKHFTYKIPGIKFSKKYRMGLIKDSITLYKRNKLPKGLYKELIDFLEKNKISYKSNINLSSHFLYIDYEKFIPDNIDLYEHQKEMIEQVLKNSRNVFESATSSGKSLSIYIINRILLENGIKTIIVVPTIMLANQIYNDFKEYGYVENIIKVNSSEKHKDIESSIKNSNTIIITKKSLPIYFDIIKENFEAIMVDECISPNSMITMANGNKKPIYKCKIGDKIISYNEKEDRFEQDIITKVYKNLPNNNIIYEIELEDGSKLEISGNHKVLTQRGWIRTDQLKEGDDIKAVSTYRDQQQ